MTLFQSMALLVNLNRTHVNRVAHINDDSSTNCSITFFLWLKDEVTLPCGIPGDLVSARRVGRVLEVRRSNRQRRRGDASVASQLAQRRQLSATVQRRCRRCRPRRAVRKARVGRWLLGEAVGNGVVESVGIFVTVLFPEMESMKFQGSWSL
jgi:hypothetical protein